MSANFETVKPEIFKTNSLPHRKLISLYNKNRIVKHADLKKVGIYSYHCVLKGTNYLLKFSETRGNVVFVTSFNNLGRLNEGAGEENCSHFGCDSHTK
jgi:hypothetical protein